MTIRQVGLAVAAAGVFLVVVGLLMAAGGFSWFGRLPGDIRVERDTFRLYIPLASLAVISAALTLILNLLRRLL